MATVADRIEVHGATRSAVAASRTAFGALLLRDVVVLRKNFAEFALRTIIQPFLLCFVFLYVFPKIGQGVGGGHGPIADSRTEARRAWSPAAFTVTIVSAPTLRLRPSGVSRARIRPWSMMATRPQSRSASSM